MGGAGRQRRCGGGLLLLAAVCLLQGCEPAPRHTHNASDPESNTPRPPDRPGELRAAAEAEKIDARVRDTDDGSGAERPSPLDEQLPEALPGLYEGLPEGMSCLLQAYPERLCGGRGGERPALIWCDGAETPWRWAPSGLGYVQRLEQAGLADQMSMSYRAGRDYSLPAPDFDPGRMRNSAFFEKMYGACEADVRASLRRVDWLSDDGGGSVRVSSVNGVDEKLAAVAQELAHLPRSIRRVAARSSGTFVWRTIAGTERLSAHSWGIAIDVAVSVSDYWRWNEPDAEGRYPYRNRLPLEIVEAFERYGFIWGGKWYHYDTMHFEYRPELLVEPCRVEADRAVPPPALSGPPR